MAQHSKRYVEVAEKVDRSKHYLVEDALELAKETATAKFDETVEAHLRMAVNPAKTEQQIRGTVILPHGTGKVPRVVVFAEGEGAKQALDAGADRVGGEDLVAEIDAGWEEFDILVAQPNMMKAVGRLGKKLGPRMPSKKGGTVDLDVAGIVKALKSGRVEFRLDRGGVIHAPIGRVSFTQEQLVENFYSLLDAVQVARPGGISGRYIKSITIATSMGPGMKLDVDKATTAAAKAV